MTKLFIDDVRNPEGDGWVIARSSQDAIDHMKNHGIPSFISWDYDLGDKDTSMNVIKWMIEELCNETISFPNNFDFYVHSQNPEGAKNIRGYMVNMIKEFKDV